MLMDYNISQFVFLLFNFLKSLTVCYSKHCKRLLLKKVDILWEIHHGLIVVFYLFYWKGILQDSSTVTQFFCSYWVQQTHAGNNWTFKLIQYLARTLSLKSEKWVETHSNSGSLMCPLKEPIPHNRVSTPFIQINSSKKEKIIPLLGTKWTNYSVVIEFRFE